MAHRSSIFTQAERTSRRNIMQKPAPATPSQHSPVWRAIYTWLSWPLYLRILIGVVAGLLFGLLLARIAGDEIAKPIGEIGDKGLASLAAQLLHGLEIPANIILRILGALAPPLILLAVIQAIMHAKFPPGTLGKLISLLLINTLAAIFIGLAVANTLQPGKWQFGEKPVVKEDKPAAAKAQEAAGPKFSLEQILDNVPRSVLGPLTDNGKAIAVIILAVAFGLALRPMKARSVATVADAVDVAFAALITTLHWVIEVIPFAVFCKVANLIGVKGVSPFVSLGGFVIAVLIALSLQMLYYLIRIRFFSWCSPMAVLYGMRDALVMAFSTGSSTATMPVTYACLREKVGVREQSASLGALVGANFNNDGTALYEAMSALFIAQLIGVELSMWQQFLVVVTSVIASVGAAGIPEAGLVTMTLVFTAVELPTNQIPMLLAVDWFLDRCRTALNVMGDVNVSCLLDGY
jgi:DAACS family dicarboxylate/amino acid:cation (Na+ or H+) symporter